MSNFGNVQLNQIITDANYKSLGSISREQFDLVLERIQKELDSPLRIHATFPTANAVLNLSIAPIVLADGSSEALPPLSSQVFTIGASTVNFQTQATSGATFVVAWPASTVGQFRRCGLTLLTNGTIQITFSAEAASVGALENPGTVFTKGGIPLGYLDLQCTNVLGYFKTAGSATNIIENAGIFKFSTLSAGDVAGPDTVANTAIARFDGTTGKVIQGGTGTISTAGAVAGLTGLTSSGTATLSGALNLSSNTTNSQTGSSVNLTAATSNNIRLTGVGLTSIGGYAITTAGRRTLIINTLATPVNIINEDLSVTAANRIVTGTGSNITLGPGASIELIYNSTTARNQVIGAAGGSGGGGIPYANVFLSATGDGDATTLAQAVSLLPSGGGLIVVMDDVVVPSKVSIPSNTKILGRSKGIKFTINGAVGLELGESCVLEDIELITAGGNILVETLGDKNVIKKCRFIVPNNNANGVCIRVNSNYNHVGECEFIGVISPSLGKGIVYQAGTSDNTDSNNVFEV
jgi:hypothetical protein